MMRGTSLRTLIVFLLGCLAVVSQGAPPAQAATLPVVTMTVDRTVIDTKTGPAHLAVTVSYPFYPWTVQVRDDTGKLIASAIQGASLGLRSITVNPPLNSTRTYTTYLVRSGAEVAMASVAVTNVGYNGTVTLTADQHQGGAGVTSTKLRLAVSDPLSYQYMVSVYDQDGRRIAYGVSGNIRSSVTVNFGATTKTWYAFVAQDAPTNGFPSNDVHAVASTWTTGIPAGDHVDGLAIATLQTAAATRFAGQETLMCVTAGELVPVSHTGSTPDITLACQAGGLRGLIEAAVATIGVEATTYLLWQLVYGQAPAVDPIAPPDPTPPAVAPPAPSDPTIDTPMLARLTDILFRRLRDRPPTEVRTPAELHPRVARLAAEQCVSAAALYAGVTLDRCANETLFLPGKNAYAAAVNDRYAIAHGRPPRLHYANVLDSDLRGQWYHSQGLGDCLGEPKPIATVTDDPECDEYPFRSTNESGVDQSAGSPNVPNPLNPVGPYVNWAPGSDNAKEGTALGAMHNKCGMIPGARPLNPAAQVYGTAYIVLPEPEELAVSTFICGDPNAR